MSSPSLASLVRTARDHVSAIASDIAALARAELAAMGKRVTVAVVLFLTALGLLPVIVILFVIVVAEALIAAGLPGWAAYLIDAGIWLVIATGLVLVSLRQFKRVHGPTQTVTAIRNTFAAIGGTEPDQAERDRAERDRTADDQGAQDRTERDRTASAKATGDRPAHDQTTRDQPASDQAKPDPTGPGA